MLKTDSQTASSLQADITAIDALFKRIAERGRKIRTQNKTVNAQPFLDGDTLTAGRKDSDSVHESKQERGKG